jgi:general secretion pathway protein I
MKQRHSDRNADQGFTLLEVLVAVALLGIAITVVLQLFSTNTRAISESDEYISASVSAESKMREILDDDNISETSYSEVTDDGYTMDVSIVEVLPERTENLQVRLLEISLKMHWMRGAHEKSFTLRTMKLLEKQV